MKIGHRIKTIRKKQGLSQEELAKHLNISFQAVSKWENNITLPDITLLPKLANFFGVSIDTLFDYTRENNSGIIEDIVKTAYAYRESDPQKSRKILKDGLDKFPGNHVLLNNLLYVTDYSRNPDETISIALPLAEGASQMEIK